MNYEFENVSIRMVKEPPLLCDKPVNSPGRAVEVLYDQLHDMDREYLIIVNLKTDMTPINMSIASVGTVNMSVSSPRELLKRWQHSKLPTNTCRRCATRSLASASFRQSTIGERTTPTSKTLTVK